MQLHLLFTWVGHKNSRIGKMANMPKFGWFRIWFHSSLFEVISPVLQFIATRNFSLKLEMFAQIRHQIFHSQLFLVYDADFLRCQMFIMSVCYVVVVAIRFSLLHAHSVSQFKITTSNAFIVSEESSNLLESIKKTAFQNVIRVNGRSDGS